ncbi:probable tRNA methyltransferase 9B [Denticeps clupeoides]|uniref:Methyltransferase type 11 domain-containing protein n=1 Tax=Denticeps clupeoides TaxID=299321 RepID=A0A8C4ARR9_9TELE|nr:probable tRNA methyltransferase 9B [Denticeps clupeoides]XP_028821593.1 probable tRNA methyltransferase 9B [Denticeps clupeoides]XP_028821594.1 probable tRNA methyltransferase 9B [Denticeps clupeoides]
MEEAANQLERDHVHSVYEKIAPYFNDSRYKAWPKVRQFLLEQGPGSIVADVGCGNGKYLHINESAFKLGCDVCRPLVDYAWCQGHEVQLCDGLRLPYRDGCFDAVLSISVIHHLSTKERRVRAIKEMARTLRVGGRVMIYVWAMEQKRRRFEKQDVFVPWNPNPPSSPTPDQAGRRSGRRAAPSVSEDGDKHRKVKSTSSMLDEGEATGSPQQSSQKLWFFSRSLDSVLDFGSLALSRSSSRELSSLCTPAEEKDGCTPGPRVKGGRLMRQVSNLFSSRSSLEEDVFDSSSDLHGACGTKKEVHPVSLVEECSTIALPDLVSYQRNWSESEGAEDGAVERHEEHRQGSSACVEGSGEVGWSREKMSDSCLRYYHVFKQGELAELVENHVEELHVLYSCLDHSNWCVVAEKVQVWKI